ncbi:MAG TPA: DNA repair protein RadC [Acidobacteriota bacterium]|nr:DNA repair protein RadC [Acidobacteriota bacterium]
MQKTELPRERLSLKGKDALSVPELFSLVIGSGVRTAGVRKISHSVWSLCQRTKFSPTISQLRSIPGVGTAKACQIIAVLELHRRLSSLPRTEHISLHNAKAVYEAFASQFLGIKQEVLVVACLDTKLQLICAETIFQGTIDSVSIHPREVFACALRHLAHSIIVIHNHPAGDPSPSSQDIEVTQLLHTVSQVVGIELIDHIIIGDGAFWSWADSK